MRPLFLPLALLLLVGCGDTTTEPEQPISRSELAALSLEQSMTGDPFLGVLYFPLLLDELMVLTEVVADSSRFDAYCNAARSYDEIKAQWTVTKTCGDDFSPLLARRVYTLQFFDEARQAGVRPTEATAATIVTLEGEDRVEDDRYSYALNDVSGSLRVEGLQEQALRVTGTYQRDQQHRASSQEVGSSMPLIYSDFSSTLELEQIALV